MALANGSGNGVLGGNGRHGGIRAGARSIGVSVGTPSPSQNRCASLRMSRRGFLAATGLLAGGALLGLAGCGTGSAAGTSSGTGGAAEVKKIVIGRLPSTAQLVVGERKGFFADELGKIGVEVEFAQFTSGPLVIEAIKSGDVTFGNSAAQPAVTSKAGGTDVRFFCTTKTTEACNALVVRDAAGIKSVTDARGKKLGYTAGTTLQSLAQKILAEAGLTENDVELVNMQVNDIVTALQSGDVDGGFIWEPMITTLVGKGGFTILRDGTGLLLEYNGILGEGSFISGHPDIASHFVTAMKTSSDWIAQNQDEAISIVAEVSGNSEEGVKALFDKSSFDVTITDDDLKSIDDTAQFLKDSDAVSTLVPAQDVVNLDPQKQAGVA